MHKAKLVRLKDGNEYQDIRIIDSEDSLLLFMEEEKESFIRLIPWNNVQFIDYDDPQAVKHVKAVAMMAMLETMDDIDESLEEIEELEQALNVLPETVATEVLPEQKDDQLTKNPYGE